MRSGLAGYLGGANYTFSNYRYKMASLRENQDLREFVIQDVQQTEEDRILGTGSYGTVEEVQLQLI